jgi:hypothetical protein
MFVRSKEMCVGASIVVRRLQVQNETMGFGYA